MIKECYYAIVPIYDGNSTAVTQYKVIDINRNMIFTGTLKECQDHLDGIKLIS